MAELPTGTVTFLFTDLEGSTRLWEQHPDEMRDALARHDEILRDAVEKHDGRVVKTTGDGLHAAFTTALDAVLAAVAAQRALVLELWALPDALQVRMGVHSGEADLRDDDYYGTAVNRAARIAAVAHGGQVVCSHATEELVRDHLTPDVALGDLGEHQLRDLSRREHLFQIAAAGLRADFPPVRSLDAYPTNLPVQVTSFVGRRREIGDVSAALDAARIVTLTGVGGVGKTRLALQVAADVLPRFDDGAWFVELAPVSDPDVIPDTIASALNIASATGITTDLAVIDDLRRRNLLLILDNCEHVLDRVARVVDDISRSCPQVVVLTTSREGLAVPGERIYAVVALATPDEGASLAEVAEADAVQLFVDRAAAVRNDFELSADNAAGIAATCRRLDGVPLALELAAARVTALHPAQIATRLDERFRLLTAGRRAGVERHQTLRATIDWSYDLLNPGERTTLNRLAVFAGGCTLDAAEAVVGDTDLDPFDVLDLLSRLVDQSLVVAVDFEIERRYRLYESIRQYAAERLAETGDTEATLRRHAEFYRELVSRIGPGLRGAEERAWLAVYEAEIENIRSAVAWFVERGDADAALSTVFELFALVFFESTQSIVELIALASEADPDLTHPLGPAAFALLAERLIQSGDVERGHELLERANTAQERMTTPPHPIMLFSQFRVAMMSGDWKACGDALSPLLERDDVLADDFLHSWMLNAAGALATLDGRTEDGSRLLRAALTVGRRTGNPPAIGMIAGAVAWEARDDDPETALTLCNEVVAIGGSAPSLATSLAYGNRTILLARAGRRREAVSDARAAIDLIARDQERNTYGGALTHLSIGLAELGYYEGAATLYSAAETMLPIAAEVAFGWPRVRDRVVEALGPAAFDAATARGTLMDRDEALVFLATELDAVEAELARND